MTVVLRSALTDQPISLTEHEELVAHHAAGAVVGFAGVVRDHDGGRRRVRLEYSAHPTAGQTLAEVLAEVAAQSDGVRAIAASHRVGPCRSAMRPWSPRWPPITAAPLSRPARDWSTRSRSGCRCGSTSSSPTAPRSGSTRLELGCRASGTVAPSSVDCAENWCPGRGFSTTTYTLGHTRYERCARTETGAGAPAVRRTAAGRAEPERASAGTPAPAVRSAYSGRPGRPPGRSLSGQRSLRQGEQGIVPADLLGLHCVPQFAQVGHVRTVPRTHGNLAGSGRQVLRAGQVRDTLGYRGQVAGRRLVGHIEGRSGDVDGIERVATDRGGQASGGTGAGPGAGTGSAGCRAVVRPTPAARRLCRRSSSSAAEITGRPAGSGASSAVSITAGSVGSRGSDRQAAASCGAGASGAGGAMQVLAEPRGRVLRGRAVHGASRSLGGGRFGGGRCTTGRPREPPGRVLGGGGRCERGPHGAAGAGASGAGGRGRSGAGVGLRGGDVERCWLYVECVVVDRSVLLGGLA